MPSYVINEYLVIDRLQLTTGRWQTRYEPLDHHPVLGSICGAIYDDGIESLLVSCANGDIRTHSGRLFGLVHNKEIILWFPKKPAENHYLCLSYEACDDEPIIKTNWLLEGF